MSGSRAMEGGTVDPVEEWVAPGGETGLEEPMWRLGLGDGSQSYPERPGEPVCVYYLRSGYCGYGNRCRFNHPTDRTMVMGAFRSGGGDHPERAGQPVCQYYMKTGTCKFGTTCKYHHPKQGVDTSTPVTLNICGYPLRLGEKECSYYVKTGNCKFGITCKFHHPQPSGIRLPVPDAGPAAIPAPTIYPTLQAPSVQSSQQYGLIQGSWPIARIAMLPGSYVPGSYGPMLFPPSIVPVPGWTPYPGHLTSGSSPMTQPTVGTSPVYGITQLSPAAAAYPGPYMPITANTSSSTQKEPAFPERPGRPECQYYLRNGDCKFGAVCKYHHPTEWISPKASFVLSSMGLPLRPGARICSHYSQNGVCKYGPSCKFDHPMRALSYSSSASSLTDMSVAPHPVGSINATLAPSSSSSDLRPDLNKEQFPPQMSPMNTCSASVGSIFSRSRPLSQLTIHPSEQSNISSAQGDETQTSH